MYRTAAARLRALKSRACSRAPARFASSSAVASTTRSSSSGGLLSWLTGGRSQPTPLEYPLPGVTLSPPLPDYVEPSKTKVTTLPNGVRIASETSVNPVASIGVYVDCGSIYETPATFGASHLLERMAFKTTTNRSYFRIVREVEAIGGVVRASASREQMIYTFDALKTHVPEMTELLLDCVRNPAFLDWEVAEQRQKVKSEISESADPESLLLEGVHSAGYSGALGNALFASGSTIDALDGSVLENFVSENFTPPRMVIAASGVEHEELVSIAEPLLADLSTGPPHPQEPKSVYTGGEYRCQNDSGKTHFALAFELPGGWQKDKEAMTLTVLEMLLGGGGSFSAGGPGKGMNSRLYLRVLKEYPQVHMFSAFSSIYNNTGLFGIQGSTVSDFASNAIDIAAKELIAIATPGEDFVNQVQLDRAKQSTKAAILMNLESTSVASEDIGKQILTYGERKPVNHFLKAVDEVTLKDITSIAQKLLSSPLTMASTGDVLHVPSYDSVSSKFRSQ